jgi:hypothetical protein
MSIDGSRSSRATAKLIFLAASLALATAATAVGSRPNSSQVEPSPPSEQPLLREGTQVVDLLGEFESSPLGIVFVSLETGQRFVVLENLYLERIYDALENQADPHPWKVTGTVTEFRGNNYMLTRRAVLTTPPALPAAAAANAEGE